MKIRPEVRAVLEGACAELRRSPSKSAPTLTTALSAACRGETAGALYQVAKALVATAAGFTPAQVREGPFKDWVYGLSAGQAATAIELVLAGEQVPRVPIPLQVDPRNVTIHNRTGTDISMWHKEFVKAASSGVLPEELADLFTIGIERTSQKVRVTVDFV